MNTGQLLMVLGALLLLSIVSLSINTLLISKTTTMLQAEASLAAISIGQTMMDEILTQYFDQVVAPPTGTKVFKQNLMTDQGSFGPDGSESGLVTLPEVPDTSAVYNSQKYYNDVDDYNNYRRYVYSTSLGVFTVTDSVYYVSESDPQVPSAAQTFFKRIVITVRHQNLCTPGVYYDQWTCPTFVQVSDIAVYRRYF